MIRRIKLHWDVPELARLGWKGSLTVRFYILADGTVADAKILRSSGIPPFDNAAFQAIIKSSPFRPLPAELHEEREGVTDHLLLQHARRAGGGAGQAVNDPDADPRGPRVGARPWPSSAARRNPDRALPRDRPLPAAPGIPGRAGQPGPRARSSGEPCYPSLAAVPPDIRIDIVDVFRRSEFVADVAAQAIARRVPFLFMQLGVVDEASARLPGGGGDRRRHGPLHPGRAREARDSPEIEECRPPAPAFSCMSRNGTRRLRRKMFIMEKNHQTRSFLFRADRGRRRLRHGGRELRSTSRRAPRPSGKPRRPPRSAPASACAAVLRRHRAGGDAVGRLDHVDRHRQGTPGPPPAAEPVRGRGRSVRVLLRPSGQPAAASRTTRSTRRSRAAPASSSRRTATS